MKKIRKKEQMRMQIQRKIEKHNRLSDGRTVQRDCREQASFGLLIAFGTTKFLPV